MGGADHDRVSEIFLAALERPAGERDAFVREASAGDAAIEREVLELIRLDTGSAVVDAPLDSTRWNEVVVNAAISAAAPPDAIGQYHILDVLGEGGMGTVYRARQSSPEREVALKVVRAGVATPETVRRFEVEVEVLGRLKHPGIAQVFEAGVATSASGPQPFFAMELIEGMPLDRHVEERGLGSRERLELMARVCDAIAHAHQRGVIHRDLKPQNVLVDELGQPKVLDFGVARASDDSLQTTTLRTQAGQLVGTVPYMSPEQVSGDPDAVDVRSDVYALGVITYQLLAGALPHAFVGKSLAEAARMILQDDPVPLGNVDSSLGGDVQTIVGKALEKEKERRYSSAAALGEDLRRHLRDEPIAARPVTTIYQLQKFARRHRAFMIGAVATIVALAVGLIWALVERSHAVDAQGVAEKERSAALEAKAQSDKDRAAAVEAQGVAENERAAALEAKAESDAVTEFLSELLFSVQADELGRDVLVRDVLEQASSRLEAELEKHPGVEARLQETLGRAWFALADSSTALDHLQRAAVVLGTIEDADPKRVLETRIQISRVLTDLERLDEALAVAEDVVLQSGRTFGPEHPATLGYQHVLAILLGMVGRRDEGDALLRQTFEASERLGLENDPEHAARLRSIAEIEWRKGERERAIELLREAVGRSAAIYGDAHTRTESLRVVLGQRLGVAGFHEESSALLRRVVDSYRERLGVEHMRTRNAVSALADLLSGMGRYVEAVPLYEDLVQGNRLAYGEGSDQALRFENNLIQHYVAAGRFDRAHEYAVGSLERHRRRFGDGHPATWTVAMSTARTQIKTNRFEDAEAVLETALEGAQGVADAGAIVGKLRIELANVYSRTGRSDEAAALFEQQLAALAERGHDRSQQSVSVRQLLSWTWLNQKRFDEAIDLMKLGYDIQMELTGPDHVMTWRMRQTLGSVLGASGRLAEAVPHLEAATARLEEALGVDSAHAQAARRDFEMAKELLAERQGAANDGTDG